MWRSYRLEWLSAAIPASGRSGGIENLAQLDKRQLHHKLLVGGSAIVHVARVAQVEGAIVEFRVEFARLLDETLRHFVAHLEQALCGWGESHQHIANVLRQAIDEEERVEATVANLFVDKQSLGNIAGAERLHQAEVVVVVEHIEVVDGTLVGDIAKRGGRHLVEDGERVAHGTVGFLCNHIEGGRLGGDALLRGDILQLLHHVVDGDAREVVDLATRQYGGDNFLLLGGGKNEDGVGGRLLKCLEECIECRRRQHVHLVDDKHAILSDLRRNLHLVDEVANVIYRVV